MPTGWPASSQDQSELIFKIPKVRPEMNSFVKNAHSAKSSADDDPVSDLQDRLAAACMVPLVHRPHLGNGEYVGHILESVERHIVKLESQL